MRSRIKSGMTWAIRDDVGNPGRRGQSGTTWAIRDDVPTHHSYCRQPIVKICSNLEILTICQSLLTISVRFWQQRHVFRQKSAPRTGMSRSGIEIGFRL